MRRVVPYLLTSLVSLIVGAITGAAIVRRASEHDFGHDVVFGLMNDGWAAREIYRGRGREHADRLRDGFPERVLGVEKYFREDDARNSALRVVGEAYVSSGIEAPVEIRSILAKVPPRPSREVPPADK